MIDSTAIDWKKNMREELRNEMREEVMNELREKFYQEEKRKGKLEAKREVALAMLQEGLTLEMIGRITKLPLAEIEKLQAQRA